MIFLVSLQLFFYLSFNHQIIRILGEMFTIPSVLLLIFLFFFSLINSLRKKKEFYLIFAINFFTVLTITVTTIIDPK